jgi:hypothetical protein
MTISQIIHEHKGAVLIRPRLGSVIETGSYEYDVKALFTGRKYGWTLLDSTTIGAMKTVYRALQKSPEAPRLLRKFDRLPLHRLVPFVWKVVAKG